LSKTLPAEAISLISLNLKFFLCLRTEANQIYALRRTLWL